MKISLTDVDTASATRLDPSPNVVDNVTNPMAANTMGNTNRTVGSEVNQRMVFKNGLILTYDSDNLCSSVYGYVPEISPIPILIIANEGYDVFTDILGITAPTV